MTISKKEFSKAIRIARQELGLTRYQLAQMFATGAGTISRWEKGISAPPMLSRGAIVNKLLDMADMAMYRAKRAVDRLIVIGRQYR